jgi:hypothetical protein
MPRRDLQSQYPFSDAHEGYIIVQAAGDVDECSDDPVHVCIVVDVSGYGPHAGSLYCQNQYHASQDYALQTAYEMHEEWLREHYADHLKELEEERLAEHLKEYLDSHRGATREEAVKAVEDDAYQQADEWSRETMDAVAWTMSAKEFLAALAQWPDGNDKTTVLDGVSITLCDDSSDL